VVFSLFALMLFSSLVSISFVCCCTDDGMDDGIWARVFADVDDDVIVAVCSIGIIAFHDDGIVSTKLATTVVGNVSV
jgi:hypothetical protein